MKTASPGEGAALSASRQSADRAGYALVLFVLIFFGLMGLAALVIDMGFAGLPSADANGRRLRGAGRAPLA